MHLTFLGATKTVTGSKYLLSAQSKKIMIDCGLFQGHKELRLRNWNKLSISPSQVDAVILTHAHIDHSGYLPILVKNGFNGKIYSTRGTKDLCSILLPDSGYIQEDDARRANKYGYTKHQPALPLYTKEDGLNALHQFYPVDYQKTETPFEGLSFTFYPAGHIIGSSIVKIAFNHHSIVFTGDLGRAHHPIMKPPAILSQADYLVIESTYGDRLHDRVDPLNQLEIIINKTIKRGGSIIIPAFAVGRSQDVLYYLYLLKKTGRIPDDVPVFLDSPMAEDVSNLLIRYSDENRLSKAACIALCKTAKYVRTPDESKAIDRRAQPMIVISTSGMIEGGRILHHLKIFLRDRRHTVLLTGYQDPGTRGDRLLRGEKQIKIHGEMVEVQAEVVAMHNLSAHADYEELLNWLSNFKKAPQKTFITHGEEDSSFALKRRIEKELGWTCVVPDYLHSEVL